MSEQSEQEGRRPIERVLAGLQLHPLPDGWTPLEGIVLVKCLDEEGHPLWAFRTTGGLNDEELLGVLTVRTDLLRRALIEAFSQDEPE
jgi:hypothetical protein